MVQFNYIAVAERGFEVTIESDAAHRCAMAVPIGAVTNAPGIVISVLIHSIQSRLDQRMRARRARVPWRRRA